MSTSKSFPICILTAGTGSRLKPLTNLLNKSLIPIANKPTISYILDNIYKDQKVIIALGYKGDLVREFLQCFYSEYNFHFVQVDDFQGSKSGPAYSLYQCHKLLQSPFYFVTCDTIWDQKLTKLPVNRNWIGTSDSYTAPRSSYCNCIIKNEYITEFINKKEPRSESLAFTGLAFVKDYITFWSDLNLSLRNDQNEIFHGFEKIAQNNKLFSQKINWSDVGNKESIQSYLGSSFDFSKTDEFIWIANNFVIKLFKNKEILQQKIYRANCLKGIIPSVSQSENFLYYKLVNGDTFYRGYSDKRFRKLLSFLGSNLWLNRPQPTSKQKDLYDFYINKTQKRLNLFFDKYPSYTPNSINEIKFSNFASQLIIDVEKLMLKNSKLANFHGDLQFDNIIIDDNEEITLIDWRNSFGSNIDSGDIYYDLAKLYGGLLLNYNLIKQNKFEYYENDKVVSFSFQSEQWQSEALNILEEYIITNNYNLTFVKKLVALIFLNMAPLHHYPFDKLLYCYSFTLYRQVND